MYLYSKIGIFLFKNGCQYVKGLNVQFTSSYNFFNEISKLDNWIRSSFQWESPVLFSVYKLCQFVFPYSILMEVIKSQTMKGI